MRWSRDALLTLGLVLYRARAAEAGTTAEAKVLTLSGVMTETRTLFCEVWYSYQSRVVKVGAVTELEPFVRVGTLPSPSHRGWHERRGQNALFIIGTAT